MTKQAKEGKGFSFNKVMIFQSLRDADHSQGRPIPDRRTGDEIESKIRMLSPKNFVSLYDVKSKQMFLALLDVIGKAVTQGLKPYLHFEMHGNKHGLEFTNGDSISWEELREPLIEINVLAKNNVYISMSACYGGYLLRTIDYRRPSPFYAYVGPSVAMDARDLEDGYAEFFTTLLRTGSIPEALKSLKANVSDVDAPYAYITCDQYFDFMLSDRMTFKMEDVKKSIELYLAENPLKFPSEASKSGYREKAIAAITDGGIKKSILEHKDVFLHLRPFASR